MVGNINMHLVTVATHSDGYFPWLLQSCKRFDAPLNVLGWGQVWKGYGWRLQLIIDFLNSIPDNDLVCFIDAFDVILLKPLRDLEECYYHNAKKDTLLIAEERPQTWIEKSGAYITFGKCNGSFINAGSYIGPAYVIKNVLASFDNVIDDQVRLVSYCKTQIDQVSIDKTSSCFLTVSSMFKEFDIKLLSLYDPCILHGAMNTNMNNVIRLLGYDMTLEQERLLNQYHKSSIYKKVLYYMRLTALWTVLIFIGIVLVVPQIITNVHIWRKTNQK